MSTNKARECALAYCLSIGWPKSSLDELERLWMAVAYATEIEELQQQNARLRTALERQLLDIYTYDEVLDIARKALANEQEVG